MSLSIVTESAAKNAAKGAAKSAAESAAESCLCEFPFKIGDQFFFGCNEGKCALEVDNYFNPQGNLVDCHPSCPIQSE